MIGFVSGIPIIWITILLIWTIPWKGYALWLAARNESVGWFIILLLVNTIGILDIFYIFAIGRPDLRKRLAARAGEAGSSSSTK